MDLNKAVKLLRSLNNCVSNLRDAFEDFEEKGKMVLKMSRCTKEIPKERNKEV